jgi:glutathione-regulated potassium-efflux system ancillary protein KefC
MTSVWALAALWLGLAAGATLLSIWLRISTALSEIAVEQLDPRVFKFKWKEAPAVGIASFFFPFLGCAAAAHYLLGWEVMPS